MFERKFMSADDGDLKEAFEKLEGLGLNPVAYRCRLCGGWLFVFTFNIDSAQTASILEREYLDMVLNDYGREVKCPDCATPNQWIISDVVKRLRLWEKEDILKLLRRHLHTRARNRGRGGAEAIYHLAKANIAKKKGGSRWRI